MLALIALFSVLVANVFAIPTWQAFNSRGSLSSLVSGANAIEAVGLPFNSRFFMAMSGPSGVPSNVTIQNHLPTDPPLYFLDRDQLYQWTNDSYILPVTVLNTTTSDEDPLPYKLVLGSSEEMIQGVSWRWRGVNLFLDHAGRKESNLGNYYTCKNTHGHLGTYMYLRTQGERSHGVLPKGCYVVRLRSYQSVVQQEEERKQQALLQSWW
ncbi:hypothetical protein K488DRAFT_81718 [Vararia minispora EC-137]|uniref:Uncharacterized protein n=1 Tax=Vararia minispora EC-137 TaxID=1314806 RepID=A0ACB8QYJ4_9AGAM|nr:hypothetical protein K488DRAFT_81718 [Vararia minispora EC-137]